MVHTPLVERIGLDNSIPIGIRLWAVCGIVSHVLALETLDVTQVLWCLAILTVASIASPIPIVPSIAIAIPVTIVVVVAIMVVTIPTMMVVSSTVHMSIPTIVVMSMVMSSIATIRIARLLLRSRVVLSTIVVVLPLAVLHGLLLAFQHNSLVNEPLAVSKSSHCQLDSQLIIQSLQELLLPCCIILDIIWSISSKFVELLNILGH